MTLNDLKELNEEEIIEVNGVELSFQVSMLSSRTYDKDQEKCLLESYYSFLNQSKQNGFMTQYIKISVAKALRIFANTDNFNSKCIRLIPDSK